MLTKLDNLIKNLVNLVNPVIKKRKNGGFEKEKALSCGIS